MQRKAPSVIILEVTLNTFIVAFGPCGVEKAGLLAMEDVSMPSNWPKVSIASVAFVGGG